MRRGSHVGSNAFVSISSQILTRSQEPYAFRKSSSAWLQPSPRESQTLFSHSDADARYGASIFWLRQGMLPDSLLEEFFERWQTNRDGTKRGIVEVKA